MRCSTLLGLLAIGGISVVFAACSSSSDNGADQQPGGGSPSATSAPSGSTSGPPTSPTDTPTSQPDSGTPTTAATIHFIGRFDTRDPKGPRFAWPGSQIRTRFSGTGATLRIHETGGGNFNDQLEVTIDGGKPTILKTTDAVESYPLASGLSDGEHDLVITKRTEDMVGTVQFFGIDSAEGRPLIATPPPFSRWIEFIGDSITCGYGVLGANEQCTFGPDTESEPLAYGAQTAAALSAGHMAIAWSGIGVYRNYDGSVENVMPQLYGRVLPNDETSVWDFHVTPDVVVVNLGTNDYAGGDPGMPYQTAMTDFAKTVREKYPNAYIVLSVSALMTDGIGWAARTAETNALHAVVDARKSAGDNRISLFEFDVQAGADGYGCDYHPNQTTQKKDADELAAYLKTLTGW